MLDSLSWSSSCKLLSNFSNTDKLVSLLYLYKCFPISIISNGDPSHALKSLPQTSRRPGTEGYSPVSGKAILHKSSSAFSKGNGSILEISTELSLHKEAISPLLVILPQRFNKILRRSRGRDGCSFA